METTALGAAYLAGRKAGVCPDLDGFAATWRLDRTLRAAHGCGDAREQMERLAGSRAPHADAALGLGTAHICRLMSASPPAREGPEGDLTAT